MGPSFETGSPPPLMGESPMLGEKSTLGVQKSPSIRIG